MSPIRNHFQSINQYWNLAIEAVEFVRPPIRSKGRIFHLLHPLHAGQCRWSSKLMRNHCQGRGPMLHHHLWCFDHHLKIIIMLKYGLNDKINQNIVVHPLRRTILHWLNSWVLHAVFASHYLRHWHSNIGHLHHPNFDVVFLAY